MDLKYYFDALDRLSAVIKATTDTLVVMSRVTWFGYTQYGRCVQRQMLKAVSPIRMDWRERVTADGHVMLGHKRQVPGGAL